MWDMEKERCIRFKLADVLKFLCFSPVLITLVYAVICLPWSTKNSPAWLQAAGSLIAIGVAIAVPWKLRVDELSRQAKAQRRMELGQYFQLSKVIGLIKAYVTQLKSGREGGVYGPNRHMLYELIKEVQHQLSVLHMASNDRLLLKLVVDVKSELAKFTILITPDDTSTWPTVNLFITKLQDIQSEVDGYTGYEETEGPERLGVPE